MDDTPRYEVKDEPQDEVGMEGPALMDAEDLGASRGRGLLRVRGGRGLLRVRGGGGGRGIPSSAYKPLLPGTVTWTPEVSLGTVKKNIRPQVCRGVKKRGKGTRRIAGTRLLLGKSSEGRKKLKLQRESNFMYKRSHLRMTAALDTNVSNSDQSDLNSTITEFKPLTVKNGGEFIENAGELAEGTFESNSLPGISESNMTPAVVKSELRADDKMDTIMHTDFDSEVSEGLFEKPFESEEVSCTNANSQNSVFMSKCNDRPNSHLSFKAKRQKVQKLKKLLKSLKKSKLISSKSGKQQRKGLFQAVKTINNGMSVPQASAVMHIPQEKAFDRLKENQPSPSINDPETFLSHDEEKQIVDWALDVSACGFPVEVTSLRNAAHRIILKRGRMSSHSVQAEIGWCEDLQKRYPHLKNMEENKESCERKEWVTRVANHLAESENSDILLDFARIFVLEQTVFEYDSSHDLFSGPVEFNNNNDDALTSGKELVSVVSNLRGDGIIAPCSLISKYSSQAEVGGKLPGFMVLKSEDGIVQSCTLLEYLHSFHMWLIQEMVQLPVLVLIDCAGYQLDTEVWNFCKSNDLILFISHKEIFQNLKCSWISTMMGHDVTQSTFVTVLRKTFDKTFKPSTIKTAFKSSGLYSLHPGVKVEMELALQLLESTISPVLLEEFKNAEEAPCWTGSPNAELLYYSWLRLKDNASWEPQRTEVEETSCCEITENGGPPQCMWVSCGTCNRNMHVECSSFVDQIEVNDDGSINTDGVTFVCTDCPA